MWPPSLRKINVIFATIVVTTFNLGIGVGQSAGPPSSASTDLAATIAAMISEPAVSRAHWGIMISTMDGTPIAAINEGQLFQPASNAKLFTTAAALALIKDNTFETRVISRGAITGDTLTGDLVLIGDGDANLSGRPVPYAAPGTATKPALPLRYLEQMADTIATSGLKRIEGNIVGDDTLFPWQPYPTDWAIDDAVWGYAAPVSALTINDNQIKLTIKPGTTTGGPAQVTLDPALPYYTVDISGLTTGAAKSDSRVEIERFIGSKVIRIYGSIAVASPPDVEEIAIEDPAEYAAIALKSMLEARGISVTGTARSEHLLSTDTRSFLPETREAIPGLVLSPGLGYGKGRGLTHFACDHCDPATLQVEKNLASHTSPSVAEDVIITNKESQNLHAELLLHQLGAAVGSDSSTAQGARVIRSFLVNTANNGPGIDPADFVFYDGSGLSGHDLVTPRATVKLLQFASTQPWYATYRSSLPIGGVDGTLEHRFTAVPLKGHVFAKTGTLGEARALSGYLECASGRTIIFSIMSGNHAPGSSADRDVMDRIVAAIVTGN